MKVARDIKSFREWRKQELTGEGGRTLGLAPTLGGLHAGHESLVRRAREENDKVLVSLFKNPTQFNDPADLRNYPGDEKSDLEAAERWGADIVFAPEAEEMYPDNYQFQIRESGISARMEGNCRPGHFEGVLTVVMKLFLITRATRAYFGEKDYQQLLLVRRMSEAFFVGTKVVPCATVRESDGLACSSRNRHLSREQREQAGNFPRILKESGDCEQACKLLNDAGFTVEYVEEWKGRRMGAVRLGSVRLIDNFPLDACGNAARSGREEIGIQ